MRPAPAQALSPAQQERLRLVEAAFAELHRMQGEPLPELEARGLARGVRDHRQLLDRPLLWLSLADDAAAAAFWRRVERRHAASEAQLAAALAPLPPA